MILNKKKILLADDEEIVRLSFQRELQQYYDVTIASSFDEAIVFLQGDRFDLLITDIVMPGRDGLELLKKAKTDSPEMCVMIITGYGEIGTVIEAMRTGADDVLLKPFDVEELLLRINTTMKRREHFTSISLYEKIFSATVDPIALVDKNGLYLEANKAYQKVYGRSREELIGFSMSEVVGQLLFNTKISSSLRLCFSGSTVQLLDLVRLGDQGFRSMVVCYRPFTRPGSTVTAAAIISMIDVTDIFHDSIGLQQSEERLQLAHSISPHAFIDCDLGTGTTFYSNNWKTLLGYAPEAMQKKGKSWQDLLHPDDKPLVEKAMQESFSGLTEFYDIELRLQNGDGSWMWYRCRGKVVERDGNGLPQRHIGLLSDITEDKVIKREFLRNKELLEQNIAQQTDDLARQNMQLTEANTAMKAVLKRNRQDREEVEGQLSENVIKLIGPLIKRLNRTRLDDEQAQLLSEIEENLRDITSSFVTRLTSEYIGLTPMEIQVAAYVKQGKATKEIADILCLAPDTINVHRKKVRKKLGISNKAVNLRTFLSSLSEE